MVKSLPLNNSKEIDIRKIGKIAFDLNTLLCNSNLPTDFSLVISSDCFADYITTRILSEQEIHACVDCLKKRNIEKVDIYLSLYLDCCIDETPKTVFVSYTSIYNAVTEIYERWFDSKPYAKRSVNHFNSSDTYISILLQPHRDNELTTITNDPNNGKLLQHGEKANKIHCSKHIVTEEEENIINSMTNIFDLPKKIVYVNDYNGHLVIRRIIEYPMTTEAKITHILSKYEKGLLTDLQTIFLIAPEDIAKLITKGYDLQAKIKYYGLSTSYNCAASGRVIFRWSDPSTLSSMSILLIDELIPEDIELLKKCFGCIVSRGGMTTHAAVVCRSLHKPCIVSHDLFFEPTSRYAYTGLGETIYDGEKISIVDNMWSIDGEIIPDDKILVACSETTMNKLNTLIKPYSLKKNLERLPIENQLHIAKLINALKKCGWFV